MHVCKSEFGIAAPILPAAAFLTLAITSPVEAERYGPECMNSTESLVEWVDSNTIVCREDADVDSWNRYEFAEDFDGTYDLMSVIGIDANSSGSDYDYDIVAIGIQGVPVTGFIYWNDLSITPGKGANMAIAQVNKGAINDLFSMRASYTANA